MIGIRAFLSDMALPLVSLVISLAIVAAVFHSRKGGAEDTAQANTSKTKVRGAVIMIVVALGLGGGGFRFLRQIQNHSTLRKLTAGSVDFIQVGDARLEKASDVGEVVDVLRGSRWYVPTAGDGGWAQTVDLTIHTKSGGELRYRVGRLLKHEGAVIDFISQDPNSQFEGHYGYAFASALPRALDRAGAPLPTKREERVPGH